MKTWWVRIVKLAVIAPSTLFTGFVAALCMGAPPFAESGARPTPPLSHYLSGLALLLALTAVWTSILTGSGARMRVPARATLLACLALGFVFGPACLLADGLKMDDAPFILAVPMYLMALWEAWRMLRKRAP